MALVQRGGYGGGKGYLQVDNRPSGGKLEEFATLTCAHCGVLQILNGLRVRPRAHCDRCSKYICDQCSALNECNFYEESLELALAHPGMGPFLGRNPDGSIPDHVRYLRDKHRISGIGFDSKSGDINGK